MSVRESVSTPVAALQRFAAINRSLSKNAESRFRIESDKPLWRRFDSKVRSAIADLPSEAVVLDVGGGRRCTFASSEARGRGIKFVAVDVSADELAANVDADETREGDIRSLPVPDGFADLVVSRTLLEHVDGNDRATSEIMRVLKPGGITIHLIPCRFALFAIAARMLPFGPMLALLHLIDPSTRGEVEFPVVYDSCDPRRMQGLFRRAGARKVEIELTYSQNDYFTAFFPIFVLVCVYQGLVRRLHLQQAATYMLISAVK